MRTGRASELLPLYIHPAIQERHCIQRIKSITSTISKETWNYANVIIKAGIDPYTVLTLILTIAGGYPSTFSSVARISIRYLPPFLAVMGGVRQFMKQQDIRTGLALQNILEGFFSGISTTAFVSQATFFLITDIVRAAEHESDNTPVYISNLAAWSVILSLFATSEILDGGRTYLEAKRSRSHDPLLTDAEVEEFTANLNKVEKALMRASCSNNAETRAFLAKLNMLERGLYYTSCNPVSRFGLSYIVPASVIHSLIVSSQNLAGVGLNPGQVTFRRIATLASGLVYAPVLGRKNTEDSKLAKFFKNSLELSMFLSLMFTFGLLYTDPEVREDLGEGTVAEQIILYCIVMQAIDATMQLSRLIKCDKKQVALPENDAFSINADADEMFDWYTMAPENNSEKNYENDKGNIIKYNSEEESENHQEDRSVENFDDIKIVTDVMDNFDELQFPDSPINSDDENEIKPYIIDDSSEDEEHLSLPPAIDVNPISPQSSWKKPSSISFAQNPQRMCLNQSSNNNPSTVDPSRQRLTF